MKVNKWMDQEKTQLCGMKFPYLKGYIPKMDMDTTRLSLLLPRNLMIKWVTLNSDIPIYHVYIHKITSNKGG